MKEDNCEGCNGWGELNYNRYSGMYLCDFCYESADEEMEEREWDDWVDNEY